MLAHAYLSFPRMALPQFAWIWFVRGSALKVTAPGVKWRMNELYSFPRCGVGASSRRELGRVARLRLSRYGLRHAVQTQCRAPSPHPEDPLWGPELAGLRGWPKAAR